ncbi:MAG: sensor histidine kinase [Rhizobacter sp.]
MRADALPALPASTGLSRLLLWSAYVGVWIVVGLFLAVAELQHYLRLGGAHPWEPFLWELSSTLTSAGLVLLVFRWHRHLFERDRALVERVGGHVLGLLLYVLLHSAGMYAVRFVVYAAAGVAYEPGSVARVLTYEAAKDTVSYLLIVLVCHGVLLFLREQQRRRDWQRLNDELTQARLARLTEQIQPHFLFNTLNLVSSVMYEDVERADRILAELGELLRRSLEAGRATTHSVAAELQLVEPFLSIMRQRFGDRLTVDIAASDEARRCEIPSLLLIAPLENAIKHGVARHTGPTRVSVSAAIDGTTLELTVTDSAALLERDARPGAIGLANTRERLAALYGDAASVTLAGVEGGTVLRIRLPARP